jgi:hypothetical protein
MSDNQSSGTSAQPVDEAGGADNRRTVVAAGVLAVVAVAAGAFFFLGGGDAEEVPAAAPATSATSAAPAAPEAAVPVAATLPTATNLSIGRNPFKVPGLYIPPPPEVPSSAAPAPVATGTAPAPVGTGTAPAPVGTGTAPAPVVPAPAPVGTAPAPGGTVAPPAPEKHKLVLLRVFGEGADRSAAFSIHGTEQIAKVGSIFGPTAEILLIELTEAPAGTWTATLQVGDGDPFDVITGEPAYVR